MTKLTKTKFTVMEKPVFLTDKGLFCIQFSEHMKLEAASLAALNRKAAKTKKFDAFPILIYRRYNHDKPYETDSVIGIQKGRKYWQSDFYKLASGSTQLQVTLDTKANRQLLEKIFKLRKRISGVNKQIAELEGRLIQRMPKEFIGGSTEGKGK